MTEASSRRGGRPAVAQTLLLTCAGALIAGGVVLAARPRYRGIRAGHVDENYLTSGTCISCHPLHYQSWARTFHSRMTREARPGSVQGDFRTENELDYLGVRARMEKRGDSFWMSLRFPDGALREFRVERTVGSRRIEQYLAREADHFVRLPLAYDLVQRRWMSLNGAFFYPDGENYFQHRTLWDGNCVFCHNVKAQPNFNPSTRQFRTEVTELGVACGACHGPAARHAERASSPLTRALWRLSRRGSRNIVHPRKLTPERSLMVCGHCHGQRIPEPQDSIVAILGQGDPYDAGEDLSRFYRPVLRDTHVGDFTFSPRFWLDGSPRLTAYEYQGILRSGCYREGDPARRINCLTCHTMHEGDPRGQLTGENRTDRPCLSCHTRYEARSSLEKHTRHRASSPGSRCYHCHMPRVVYGVMSVHPTHEITVPDPRLTAARAVPNACNQCHLDRSVNWSLREVRRLWPGRFPDATPSPDSSFDIPEGPRSLFAGDALTRALAAEAMGGGGPVRPDASWAAPFLVEALWDSYPIVRFFASNGLAAGGWGLPKVDYLAPLDSREALAVRWRERTRAQDPALRHQVETLPVALRATRREVDLEVGE